MNALEPIELDWPAIKTVFLDMDGTLLDLHYDNHFWLEYLPTQFAEKNALSLDEAHQELRERYKKIEGTLNWYSLEHWSKELEMDIHSLKHHVAEKIAVRANVQAFLSFLGSHDCEVIMLTNAHRQTLDIKFQYVDIEAHFDRIITSHDLGMAKEEAGFWDKVHDAHDFSTETSLFIDDNLAVLNEAEAHGVKHLLAIHQPDSQQPPKDTRHYTAIECYTQLMSGDLV